MSHSRARRYNNAPQKHGMYRVNYLWVFTKEFIYRYNKIKKVVVPENIIIKSTKPTKVQ